LISHEPIKLFTQYEFTEILVNNLLRNACQYTTDATVKVNLFKHHFLIENTVENSSVLGLSDNIISDSDDYGYGYGLGLFLAEIICDQLQWQLEITSQKNTFSVKVMFDNAVK
jgi:signal transduction histidine kinase